MHSIFHWGCISPLIMSNSRSVHKRVPDVEVIADIHLRGSVRNNMSRQSIQSLTIVRVCPHFKNERGEKRSRRCGLQTSPIFSDTTEPESLLIIPQLSPRVPDCQVLLWNMLRWQKITVTDHVCPYETSFLIGGSIGWSHEGTLVWWASHQMGSSQ